MVAEAEMTEQELFGWVKGSQEGDAEAFAQLSQRFRPIALIAARRILREDLAEDAVQEALITAFRAIKNLENPDCFAAWFATIVRNRCKRMARQSQAMLSLETGFCEVGLVPTALIQFPPEPPPMDWDHVVTRLPERLREIFELYYRNEYSVAEIAAYLSLPATTIKWQLHAGRTLLRNLLEEDNQ